MGRGRSSKEAPEGEKKGTKGGGFLWRRHRRTAIGEAPRDRRGGARRSGRGGPLGGGEGGGSGQA